MYELPRTIPDVKMLLALAPEELGSTILFLPKKRNEAKFHTGNLQNELRGHFTSGQPQYPRQNENEINLLCRKRGRGSRRRDLSFRTWRTGSTDGSC